MFLIDIIVNSCHDIRRVYHNNADKFIKFTRTVVRLFHRFRPLCEVANLSEECIVKTFRDVLHYVLLTQNRTMNCVMLVENSVDFDRKRPTTLQ